MMSRIRLAWAIAVWTAVAWGGRVAIVFDVGSDLGQRLRIGVSVIAAIGVVLALATGRWVRPVVLTYWAVTTIVWVRSVIVVFSEERTGPFLAVHTVLALGSLILAAAAVVSVWREPRV